MSIQKCKPSFGEGNTIIKRAPFTQLYNKVLQTCTNMEAIAVWAYLQSQVDNWELNPVQLRNHFKVGKEKIYSILTYMIDTKLLVRNVQYAQGHRHIKTTYTVLDGMEFLDTACVVEENAQENALLPEKPEPETREPENQDYRKERSLEKKDHEKDINNICASDDAPVTETCAFNEFWNVYPIKKNKLRAKKIWDSKKVNKIALDVINDVCHRLTHDGSWIDLQFVPHPSTYLQNERWKDSISPPKTNGSKNSSGDALSRVINKHLNKGNVYDHSTGNTIDPLR